MSEQPRRRRRPQIVPVEQMEYDVPEQHSAIYYAERAHEPDYQINEEYHPSSAYPIDQPKGANALSIAGFVVSLVSLFILALYGITGTIGLILSAVGRSHAVSEGRKTGLATAGIILGIISIMGGIVNAFIFLS